jgi:hypothetical protein
MGKSLQDLGLREEALPTAGQTLADLPEFGTFREPPQPGSYRFQLPDDLSAVWDVYDAAKLGNAQRVRAIFDKDHPLKIVQSAGGTMNNEPFETRISNEERKRGKENVVASDMDYLLRAFKVTTKPASNRAYIDAVRGLAKREFGADIRFSWRCAPDRNIRVRVVDPQTGATSIQEVPDRKGCTTAYYQEDLPNGGKQADGLVPTQIQCACGAVLRAFANLDNIRA